MMRSLPQAESSRESIDRQIARLAAKRYGVFSRADVERLGGTKSAIDWRIAIGRWERVSPGIYRLAGVASSWRQSLLAACLSWGVETSRSHRAAAAVFELAGFEAGIVELIVPRGRWRKDPGAIIHRVALPAVDRMMVAAIPVTTPARTLIDLASVAPAHAVEEALDDALRSKLVSVPRLRWRLAELGRRGRPGVRLIRELVDARGSSAQVPQSVFETRMLRVLSAAGVRPIVQHEVRSQGRLVAVVDFAFPDQRLAIEADGFRWHSGRSRWESDRARRNELTLLGWRVIHVTWNELSNDPGTVVGSIRRALVGRSPL
jgi:very-short-patch-repair endonuclease